MNSSPPGLGAFGGRRAAARGTGALPPWRGWWHVGVGLTAAASFACVLATGLVVTTEPASSPGVERFFVVATSLFWGSVAVLVVDALAARGARRGRRRSLRYVDDPRLRAAVRTAVLVVGGVGYPVFGAVLGLVVPLVIVGFLVRVFLGGGTSASPRPYAHDPHPGYWRDAQGRTHSRTDSTPGPGQSHH